MKVRLLALDVDGTLLRNDGTVAPDDRAAIAALRAEGVTVTLATGRLSSSALPVARALALEAPLVCADGAVLYCPTSERPLDQKPLAQSGLTLWLSCLRDQALAPFVFTHEAVCGAAADFEQFPFVDGWTPLRASHDDLGAAVAGEGTQAPISAIGVGGQEAVLEAERRLRADTAIADEVMIFPIRTTPYWVVRLTPSGCNKARGLAELASRLGLSAAQVASIGDWYNDISMLEWARWSYSMGQAPDEVKRAAKHALRSTAATGGGVAELLAHLRGA